MQRRSWHVLLTIVLLGCSGRGLALRPARNPAEAEGGIGNEVTDGGSPGHDSATSATMADGLAELADASAEVSTAATCPPGAHCWTFDDDPLGGFPSGPWAVIPGLDLQGSQPKVQVDVPPPGGSRAVHVTGLGQAFALIALDTATVDPRLARELRGRMRIWPETLPGDRWRMIEASGKSDQDGSLGFGGFGLVYEAQCTLADDTDCYRQGMRSFTAHRWSCVEWHFKAATATGSNDVEIWIDGCPVGDVAVGAGRGSQCDDNKVHEWRASSFDRLRLGVESYVVSSVPFSLWIDDVAVSAGSEPIGCPDVTPACGP
jgi:hypothetical protein